MGIELKITADSVADLNQQMALMLNGAPIVVDVKHNEDGSPAEIEVPPAKPARAPRKAKADEPVASAEGNVPTAVAPTATDADGAEAPAGSTATPLSTSPAAAEGATSPAATDEPQVQYADVQKAVTGLAAAKGRDAVMKVYDNFGVDHATKLKPEQWVDVIAELDAAREAA